MNERSLISFLKRKRQTLGLSQAVVARAAEISGGSVIRNWEELLNMPRLDMFVAWAEVLGYSVVLQPIKPRSQRGPKK